MFLCKRGPQRDPMRPTGLWGAWEHFQGSWKLQDSRAAWLLEKQAKRNDDFWLKGL